jgi:hypothetical protein
MNCHCKEYNVVHGSSELCLLLFLKYGGGVKKNECEDLLQFRPKFYECPNSLFRAQKF